MMTQGLKIDHISGSRCHIMRRDTCRGQLSEGEASIATFISSLFKGRQQTYPLDS